MFELDALVQPLDAPRLSFNASIGVCDVRAQVALVAAFQREKSRFQCLNRRV